jgi:predicted DsbA family dithiol-disulfide isomerase
MERRFGARVEWLPFDLHPEYPPEGIPRERLAERYGHGIHDHTRQVIEAAGLDYNPPAVLPNSRKALEVSELARDADLHEAVHDRLMHAYWSEARDIGDEEVLLDLVAEAGLDRSDAKAVFADRRYAQRVDESTREAQMHGIHAIPAFVLGGRLLLLGAHPHEVFERAVAQLGVDDAENA